MNTPSGLSRQSQESRPQQSDGSSGKGSSNVDAQKPSIRSTPMSGKRPGERSVLRINEAQKAQTNADAYSEAASSPRASEGDASATAMASSDLDSQSFCSVSEIATDAGHHAMSEDSDNDDGRSVSSEPASRFISKLTPPRSTGSKLGRGVYSSWDSKHGSDSLDSSAIINGVNRQDSDLLAARDGEEIDFPYFLEDTDSLVGDTDGLDSFLDAGIGDPEDINRSDGYQIDLEQFRAPEVFTARHHGNDIIDREGSMRQEVAVIYNNEAALTADHHEFELRDCLLMDHGAAPIYEGAGVAYTNAAVLPSTTEARTELSNTEISSDSASNEKSHVVTNADIDIAPQFPQSPNHNSDYESAIASISFPDSGGSAERVEENSDPAPEVLNLLAKAVEVAGHPPRHVTIEEPENLSDIELTHDLCDSVSPSGQEKLGEACEVLPDPVHIEEQDYESRSLGVECNRVSEGVADNEDLPEMRTIAREDSEHTQTAPPPRLLLEKELGNNDYENSEDGTPGRGTSNYEPEDTQDAELTYSEPDENRSDVKWSFVSALYDDLEDVHNTVDIDGYGLPEHKLVEAGEAGNSLTQNFEPFKYVSVPESEAVHHAESAAIDVVWYGGEDKENVRIASASLVEATQGWDSSANDIASKSDEPKEVEIIERNERVGSNAEDVPGANSSVNVEGESRSFPMVQETFEALREENTSETTTEMEEIKTWSVCCEEEEANDLGVNIQAQALAGETEISTGLKEHESRLPSSEDQDGISLQGDKHSQGLKQLTDLVPEKLEETSHENTAATSQPRKMQQILSIGLKMIIVIGSITFGILKFRASRLRLAGKS